jgi:hypothetical protein
MDGMDTAAVLEAPDAGTDVELPETHDVDAPEGGESQAADQGTQQTDDDPYSAKSSKEFSNALKTWRDSSPENAKFARMAKDDHSRLYQLHQLEPKGIEGVREKYALLDGVMHGELKGAEAVGAMQDELRIVQETDAKIAAGDPTALDDLGDEFVPGLAKLAPHILDRVMQSDPDAAWNAMRPHFVSALQSSPVVQNHDALVDIFNEKPPEWLPEERKAAWIEDKFGRMAQVLNSNGAWLRAQLQGAKPQEQGKVQPGKQQQPALNDERAEFEREKQEHHWKTNITPQLDKHAEKSFEDLFKPYDKRLRLDPAARSALGGEFIKRVIEKAMANPAYKSQIGRYRSQKNPDAGTVLNFAKVEFDRHAKSVMESLITDRGYRRFLGGTPKPPVTAQPGNGQPKGPVGPKEFVVAVRPEEGTIDFKNSRFKELRHQGKFPLKDGRIAVLRK